MKFSLTALFEKSVASRLWSLAIMALAGLIAYAPGLNGEFLWDDSWLVNQNPFFKSPVFLFEVFKHYLYLEGTSTYYRPLQNISYMPDYWLWHNNPFGYHLSNVFFHVLSGWLLFQLIRKILPVLTKEKTGTEGLRFFTRWRDAIAFGVALLWIVHPIHNAAVAYIAGRADSLASLFSIAAWLIYWKARGFASRPFRVTGYGLALVLCVLGVCSKEIAITWFCLFVFFTLAFDRQTRLREKLAAVAGLVLVVTFCFWLRHLPSGTAAGATRVEAATTLEYRVILAFRALGDYAGLIFFPSHLHMDRTVYQVGPYASVAAWQDSLRLEYLSVIGAAAAAMLLFFSVKKFPGQRVRIFGAIWFLIGFVPISNLFPLNAQVAEHWIYMASFGFLFFLAGCLAAMPRPLRAAAVGLACLAIPTLMLRTSKRAYEWADAERFYKQTIADGGGSVRVHLNLALVYSARGDVKTAEEMLRHTVRHSPDYLPARLNLGINLLRQGRQKEAEQYLKFDPKTSAKISKEQPHTWSAALNMAHMRHNEKRPREALAILDEAIPRYHDNWDLVDLHARILRESESVAAAIPGVEAYARAHWWHYESQMALARLQAGNGDAEKGIAALRNAASLDVHAVAPFVETAHLRFDQKKFAEAAEAMRRAIGRDSDQPTQYLFLATIYEQWGRPREAALAMRTAEGLRNEVAGKFRHF